MNAAQSPFITNTLTRMKEVGKTHNQVSREAHITSERLYDLLHGSGGPTTWELAAIAKSLNTESDELLKKHAGFKKPAGSSVEVKIDERVADLAKLYTAATPDQRKSISKSVVNHGIRAGVNITSEIAQLCGVSTAAMGYWRRGRNAITADNFARTVQIYINKGVAYKSISRSLHNVINGKAEKMAIASVAARRARKEAATSASAATVQTADTPVADAPANADVNRVAKMYCKISQEHRTTILNIMLDLLSKDAEGVAKLEEFFWEDLK